MSEIEQIANEAFETDDESSRWLRTPHPLLDDETPLEVAKTAAGVQRVKEILLAIRFGGVV